MKVLSLRTFEDPDEDPARCFEWNPSVAGHLSPLTYWRETLRQPLWGATAAVGVVAMLVNGWLAAAGLVIATILGFTLGLSALPPVRRRIARRLEEREEEGRRTRRIAARMSLDERERRGLEYLEDVGAGLRARVTRGEAMDLALFESTCGISTMIACYARCGIALRARRERLARVDRGQLERTLCHLSENPRSRWCERRRVVLEARLEHLDRLDQEIDSLKSIMAAIVERMEMLDEQCVPPVPEPSDLWLLESEEELLQLDSEVSDTRADPTSDPESAAA